MSRLVNELMRNGYLKSDTVISAFAAISRIEFVCEDLADAAEKNIPLPIGYGQTISQPLTVAFMLELLDVHPDQRILDIGSGSGWTTALLSHIVGEKGKVVGIEVIKELCEFGIKNVEKFGFIQKGIAEIHCIPGNEGFIKHAPYDRILVSAVVDEIPAAFKNQLKVGGKMVIPVHNAIWYVEKKGEDDFYIEKFPGFAFVPFVENSRI